jgi:phosphatidylglycerophosphate synthase
MGTRNLGPGLGLLIASVLLYVFGLCYGGYAPFWLGVLCYLGMLMPSYVRAKSESAGAAESVQGVGIAERKEKLAILITSTALVLVRSHAVFYGMMAIAALSQISTFQSLHFASKSSGAGGQGQSGEFRRSREAAKPAGEPCHDPC